LQTQLQAANPVGQQLSTKKHRQRLSLVDSYSTAQRRRRLLQLKGRPISHERRRGSGWTDVLCASRENGQPRASLTRPHEGMLPVGTKLESAPVACITNDRVVLCDPFAPNRERIADSL